MNDPAGPEQDPVDRLLAPPHPEREGTLRQTVLARTKRVLWRRRLARRLVYASVLAACYMAGLLNARWLTPPPVQERVVIVERRPPDRAGPAPAKEPDPEAVELAARQSEARQAELYRQAGDLYATEEGDLQAALRCYGRSLDTAPAKDRQISLDDHWLLMAIKDAREKEKVYAKIDP